VRESVREGVKENVQFKAEKKRRGSACSYVHKEFPKPEEHNRR